ncbi:hypothetical protein BZG36_00738 [Bifiguratus adelaidae]|uniref:HBS1-like protein N-terminal domain-containing protein n=1 Tax=Bifiguratus adelaidae TaxID=1938954 RepID=A0A261Y6Y0_9FUNG|nr:hypothetical protein BZG36_00738 [Bifiguratus adelaidae]
MSRHRNVRNLDVEDVLARDQYDEEDEAPELTAEEETLLDEGTEHIRAMLPADSGVSNQEIRETLYYYYYDQEESLNYLLGKAK